MEQWRVRLRALTKSDSTVSWNWRNADALRDFYAGHPFYINEEKEQAWFDKILTSDIPLSSFGIEQKESNILIGMSFLKDINLIHRTAELAIFIGDEKYTGKGLAKEATLQTVAFAFDNLNLHRVYLVVQEDNIRAIELYLKCGFIKEGVLRESVFKNGKYLNKIIMSILKTEYLKQ
ncbi:GNAT family N-acetyltransferase [Aquimarina intermedia]|uniref:RimJ/RimL family protein N-acetyltransferase n=1 Tax=Aquimarina intermedia TaxID=350814 RepID=A0A5S5CEJ6_9FLAO|nr:GNAT family protein [Aquimarina intermedia]TYP76932.1 RimJ/RimL family protein N-acetyltransferase [Aquimarina intermedia]